MRDKAKKYAKMFSKVMKKLCRSDYKKLESIFYKRYTAHMNSEMYQKYCKTYPSSFNIIRKQKVCMVAISLDITGKHALHISCLAFRLQHCCHGFVL